jgi:hypothetical protein
MKLLRDLVSRLHWKRPVISVRLSDDTVTLFEGDRPGTEFAWNDVCEVVTFKRDLGIYDDICLGFRIDERWIEISEEIEGWGALTSALRVRFPTIPDDWYGAVMLPPFAKCYRVLYGRSVTERPSE